MAVRLSSILFSSMALVDLALAAGATMRNCYGFNNGNGFNVNIQYSGVQSQSRSSICTNLQNKLNGEYKWCMQATAINCGTTDDLLFFGASTKDQDSGFSCVQAAFIDTLQASVVPGPLGPLSLVCRNIDDGVSTKRSSIEARTTPMDPNVAAAIGQTITIASGETLIIVGLDEEVGSQTGFISAASSFFTDMIPRLAFKMGNVGKSLVTQSVRSPDIVDAQEMTGSMDAGFQKINVDEDNYKVILPAVGRYITGTSKRQGAMVKFAIAGATVTATLYVYVGLI